MLLSTNGVAPLPASIASRLAPRNFNRWTQRACLAFLLFSLNVALTFAQREVNVGVLGLFHPRELMLAPAGESVLSIASQGDAATPAQILNGEAGRRQLLFRAQGGRALMGARSAIRWTATARDGAAAAFQLTVPGRFRRIYFGRLTIQVDPAHHDELLAVIEMDRETAVASIVASEMDESAPLEALKAQAVAARSFVAAGQRHLNFDFCDTTHCQFLKSPPALASRVTRAVQSTRGMILVYRGKPLAALYSSRCGGRTRSLRDAGMEPGGEYPYYAVPCAWCRRHPLTGHSGIGNSGHGVGMCQHGASGMAGEGASFRQILSHFYPNTQLTVQP